MNAIQEKLMSKKISAGLLSAAIAFVIGTCAAIGLGDLLAAFLGRGDAEVEVASFVIAPLFGLLCGYLALFDFIRFGKR